MAGRSQLPVQIMENQTRFDLNAAVDNWRNELAAQPNLASDDRRELEAHLRDAIAGFQQRGLNDEESFWLARKRVGQPPQLGEEFVKANPTVVWREWTFWMVLSLAAFQLWNKTYLYLSDKQFVVRQFDMHHHLIWIGPFWVQHGGLFAILFPTLFYLLPLVCLIIIFANGWMNWFERAFRFIFRSRLQFILTALALVLIVNYYNDDTSMSGTFMYGSNWFLQYCTNILVTNVWPLTLIALVTWLMPKEKRKTLKLA